MHSRGATSFDGAPLFFALYSLFSILELIFFGSDNC